MIPFKTIRSTIVRNLSAYLGLELVEMSGGGDIPKTAFLTYDISDIEPLTPTARHVQDGVDHYRTRTGFTITFMSYADDKATSVENAMRAQDWFKTFGYQTLKDVDVIVYEMTPVSNRDVLIGDEWERRQGFDIEFRTQSLAEMPLTEWIEQTKLTRSE